MGHIMRVSKRNVIAAVYISVLCISLWLVDHTALGFSVNGKQSSVDLHVGRVSLSSKMVRSLSRKGGHRIEGDTAEGMSGEVVPSSLGCALRMSGGGGEGDEKAAPKSEVSNGRELLAEFLGTFLIVQLGCGTVCAAIFKSAQVGLWQIAAVWSLAVTLAISTTASVSGAHLNPAITFCLALLRGFSWTKVLPFVVAQVAGATAAAAVNLALFRDSIASFEATNSIVRGSLEGVKSAAAFGEYWSVGHWSTAFLAEAYGTAVLAFVIFALTHSKNSTARDSPVLIPPLIGATVGALISVIAPLTQAGFNPARDFGPRIVAMLAGWGKVSMQGAWLYIIAPLIGAPIGAFIAEKVLYADDKTS